MEHVELALAVRPQAVEAIADILRRFAPAGVSIETPFDAIDEEGGVELSSDSPVQLRAWLTANDAATERAIDELRTILSQLSNDILEPLRIRTVAEADWADAWKEYFHVMRVGENLVLRPSWRSYDAEADDIVIEVDPGRAFGTGQHETTRMCLIELERRIEPGARVLDVGSGSGILSVAAALLGAKRVDAVDIDPAAVAATRENVSANGVAGVVRVAQGSLGSAWPFAEVPAGQYDLVIGNLSARIVRELANDLLDAVGADGAAIVSGIIEEQESSCVEALLRSGGKAFERRTDGDWRLLAVSR